MDNQKISLDIRTILAQLGIQFERYAEWEGSREVELCENTDWLETTDDSVQQVAAAQS